MPGIPSVDKDKITEARAQILVEERLRELCKRYGFKFPDREMCTRSKEATEETEEAHLRFPSIQDQYRAGMAIITCQEIEEVVGPLEEEEASPSDETRAGTQAMALPPVIKEEPDVKPRRLLTTYLGPQSLLKWTGTGDEEHIITKVVHGNDPLSSFYEDSEETWEEIIIEELSDSEDNLLEVSLDTDARVITEQLQATLQGLSDSHNATAKFLGDLAEMVTRMSEVQLDDTVQKVASQMMAVQGWDFVTGWFDRREIATTLAVGIQKYQEFEIVKGKRAETDVI